MLGWIKKRCRRRSDPVGDRLKYDEEMTQGKQGVSDCPVYFTIETAVTCPGSINIDDHVYEEINNSETNDASYDILREISSLTKRMEDEFGCKEQICPLCRCKHEQFCACVDPDKAATIPAIYELGTNPFYQKERRRSHAYYAANRPLPNLPRESPIKSDTMSDDDSSGFYESVGSDSDGSSDNQDYGYNLNGLNFHKNNVLPNGDDDDENDYEEIDIKPKITQKRRHSLSSFPEIKSPRNIFQNTVKGKEPCLSTTTRRGPLFKPHRKKSRLSALTLRRLSSKLDI
ncbi:hypothetical protein SNE40_005570 [Patella caerulea]|uniref:Uncharacterized protein n=1 Tax=Patella caerulea TaxID=87958 RepID=A0AAN8Q057_PATCE